jgi:surface antigen
VAYRVEGEVCRDFLASYVADGAESWFQGEACREAKGKWEVRRMKAWRRS